MSIEQLGDVAIESLHFFWDCTSSYPGRQKRHEGSCEYTPSVEEHDGVKKCNTTINDDK
jgi:hypothetical protein